MPQVEAALAKVSQKRSLTDQRRFAAELAQPS